MFVVAGLYTALQTGTWLWILITFPGYVDENLYQGVRVVDVYDDQTPGRMIFNPGHPHANEDGMVEMPNVDVSREMIDLISASRAYEANLTVVKTSRRMAQQALAIGR